MPSVQPRSQRCLITKPSLFTHQERQCRANKGDSSAASAERPLIWLGVPGAAAPLQPPVTNSSHLCQGDPSSAHPGSAHPSGIHARNVHPVLQKVLTAAPSSEPSTHGAQPSPRLPILRSLLGSGFKADCHAYKPGLDCLHTRQMSPSCNPDGSLYSPAPSPPVFVSHAERSVLLKARDKQTRLACMQRLLGNSLRVYKGAWLSAVALGALPASTGGFSQAGPMSADTEPAATATPSQPLAAPCHGQVTAPCQRHLQTPPVASAGKLFSLKC